MCIMADRPAVARVLLSFAYFNQREVNEFYLKVISNQATRRRQLHYSSSCSVADCGNVGSNASDVLQGLF